MSAATTADAPVRADPRRVRAARRTLLLLAAVCILPVAASYFAYYVWQPGGRVNYGELLTPAALPEATLAGVADRPGLARGDLAGRWTLVFAGAAACDAACEDMLYLMRQSRLAQGQEMERVARLWLVTDGGTPAREMLDRDDGLHIAHAAPAWLERLPGAHAGRHVFLVDPLGNVMMRFPEQADPRRVVKDLQRLLKYSALGRNTPGRR